MVWDWRSFHSLVPKVASFGVGHKEKRRHKDTHKAAGVDIGLRRQKKSAADVMIGWHIHLPVIYCVCWKAMRFFIRDFWGLLTTFRASEVCGFYEFPRQSSPMFSLVALQHRLPKKQCHRRLTSAAFGDIIKLQNRYGGSLPKGR